MLADPRIAGLVTLIAALALILGAICHSIFAAEVLAMIGVMFFGPGNSLGTVPRPWAFLAKAALIMQFALAHSALLTGRGGRLMARLIPVPS